MSIGEHTAGGRVGQENAVSLLKDICFKMWRLRGKGTKSSYSYWVVSFTKYKGSSLLPHLNLFFLLISCHHYGFQLVINLRVIILVGGN